MLLSLTLTRMMQVQQWRKHCNKEIYLQYLPVTPRTKWICFDTADGRIHSCPVKPLTPELKQLIQEAVERMNYTNNTNTIIHDIYTVIESLRNIRQNVNNNFHV